MTAIVKATPRYGRTPKHGSRRMYRDGCRCYRCAYAHSVYMQNYRKGIRTHWDRVPSLVAQRMVRALQRQGRTTQWISDQTGVPKRRLQDLMRGIGDLIDREYDAAVRSVYARFEITSGIGSQAKKVASEAEAKGWLSPWDWDDITDPREMAYIDSKGRLTRRWVGGKTDRDQGDSSAA